MYKQIFKKGVNDKSIKLAGEYAKEVVKSFVTKNIAYTLIKESLKIMPIVKVPTAEIEYIPKK